MDIPEHIFNCYMVAVSLSAVKNYNENWRNFQGCTRGNSLHVAWQVFKDSLSRLFLNMKHHAVGGKLNTCTEWVIKILPLGFQIQIIKVDTRGIIKSDY